MGACASNEELLCAGTDKDDEVHISKQRSSPSNDSTTDVDALGRKKAITALSR